MRFGINDVVKKAEDILNQPDFHPKAKDVVKSYTWAVFHAIAELAKENPVVIKGFGKFFYKESRKKFVPFLNKTITTKERLSAKISPNLKK